MSDTNGTAVRKENIHAVLVDWGTSNFRLWLLNEDGIIEEGARTAQGMSKMPNAQAFSSVLNEHLYALGVQNDIPVVICGMAGSRQGWKEATYVDLPASLETVIRSSVSVDDADRDIRILPGLAQRSASAADVIRGEETQLAGALKGRETSKTICMPGTHSKWVRVEKGKITGFTTFMTGELFALLSQSSTLSHSLAGSTKDERRDMDMDAFDEAVLEMHQNPGGFSSQIFSVRAGPLLGLCDASTAIGRLSGLLIGLELAGARQYSDQPLALLGSGALLRLYERGLELTGRDFEKIDADDAVCTGLQIAASSLWPLEKTKRKTAS